MAQAQDAMNWLNSYTSGSGMNNYLSQFMDINHYRNSSCFKIPGCTAEEWARLHDRRELASGNQMNANNALFKNTVDQAQSLAEDAGNLLELRTHAVRASDDQLGHMAALVNANELAAFQADQILKLRSAMTSLMQVIAIKAQAESDTNAKLELTSDLSNKPSPTYMTGATADDEPLSIKDLILDWDV